MAHINLLSWRAERRNQRKREFFMQLGAALVVGILFILLWSSWMGLRIDNQNERNTYLQDQIKQVDVKIAKIKNLEKVRSQLLARKQIIEQLQANRSQMVHLFDELVKTIPPSVRLTAVKQNGQQMTLDGVAESNASVADYMRNIEKSPWMGPVSLSKTENTHEATRMPYTFDLTVTLNKPKQDTTDKTGTAPAVGAQKAATPLRAKSAAMPARTTRSPVPATSVSVVAVGQKSANAPAGHAVKVKQAGARP